MLRSTLLVDELRDLVDGLLLLAELHIRPEVVISGHDMDERILGILTPEQSVKIVAALDGCGVVVGLGELEYLDLSRRGVGGPARRSDPEVVVILLSPHLYQRSSKKYGDPLLGDLSPVLLDVGEPGFEGVDGEVHGRG